MFTVNQYIDRKLSKLAPIYDQVKKADEFIQLGSYQGQRDFIIAASRELATEDLSPLQKEYRAFFTTLLENYGVSSPSELTDEQKVEIFNTVQNNWVAGKGPRKDFDVNEWEPETAASPKGRAGKSKVGGKSRAQHNINSKEYYNLKWFMCKVTTQIGGYPVKSGQYFAFKPGRGTELIYIADNTGNIIHHEEADEYDMDALVRRSKAVEGKPNDDFDADHEEDLESIRESRVKKGRGAANPKGVEIDEENLNLVLKDKELKGVHKEAKSLLNRADKLAHKVNFDGLVSIKDIDESVDVLIRRDFDKVCRTVASMSGNIDKNIDKVYDFFSDVCDYLEAVIDVCNDLSAANKELKSAQTRVNKRLTRLSTDGFN